MISAFNPGPGDLFSAEYTLVWKCETGHAFLTPETVSFLVLLITRVQISLFTMENMLVQKCQPVSLLWVNRRCHVCRIIIKVEAMREIRTFLFPLLYLKPNVEKNSIPSMKLMCKE